MSDHKERYLEIALDELYHGGPSGELADRIVASDSGTTLSIVKRRHRPRPWFWLQAASVLAAVGLITFLLFPRDSNELPDGVATSAGKYELRDGQLEINEGWYALTTGAPLVSFNDVSIEQVSGRTLVKVGSVPDETELQTQHEWLQRNGMENAMNFKWIQAGGLAICVLAGTAVVDGTLIEAQGIEARNNEKVRDWEAFEDEIEKDKERIEDLLSRMEVASLRVENAKLDVTAAEKEGNVERIKEAKDAQAKYQKEYKDLEDQYYKLANEVNIREYELKVHKQEGVVAERKKALERNPEDANAKKAALEAERELLSLKLALKTYREDAEAAEAKAKTEEPITVDFVRKDIHTIVHYIALKSGLQIIVQGEMDLQITVSLKDLSAKDALQRICEEHGLEMVEDGKVIILKKAPKRYDFNFDGTLGDAIATIETKAGVEISAGKALQTQYRITLSVSELTARQVLDLLCDDLELALVVIGDGYIIREQLPDCTKERLSNMIVDHRDKADALENRIQFAIVALEGAREAGDEDAVKESEKKLRSLKKTKADHEAELTALKAELEKRGDRR